MFLVAVPLRGKEGEKGRATKKKKTFFLREEKNNSKIFSAFRIMKKFYKKLLLVNIYELLHPSIF